MFTQSDWRKNGAPIEPLVANNTEFAMVLYQELRAEPGNLSFSPHSIATALAMTCAGTRGRTAV
ncbi:MAG: hypothetical protein IPK53_10720 [bacterium]|nr:hypothetical protein [bacterium]